MMNKRLLLLGSIASIGLIAGRRLYRRRPLARRVSHEGLDDPAVARGFGLMAKMPPLRLLRWAVARRAVASVSAGAAADLGCGPGDLVMTLAQMAPRLAVTGVDLSEEMLAQAEERTAALGLGDRVSFRQGDAADVPFPNGSLDLVVSTLSLHHWSDPVAALDEIARVLRPGGSFLVFDLRRDMAGPFWLLLWFVTHAVVPRALRRVNEPLGSRDAAYTPEEAVEIAGRSTLRGWRVTRGPLWLLIEGRTPED